MKKNSSSKRQRKARSKKRNQIRLSKQAAELCSILRLKSHPESGAQARNFYGQTTKWVIPETLVDSKLPDVDSSYPQQQEYHDGFNEMNSGVKNTPKGEQIQINELSELVALTVNRSELSSKQSLLYLEKRFRRLMDEISGTTFSYSGLADFRCAVLELL